MTYFNPIILLLAIFLTSCHAKKQVTDERLSIDLSRLRALTLFDTTTFYFNSPTPFPSQLVPVSPTTSQQQAEHPKTVQIIRHAQISDQDKILTNAQSTAQTTKEKKPPSIETALYRYTTAIFIILMVIIVLCLFIRFIRFLV